MVERDAYTKMAVAKARAMEASNKYTALMEMCLTDSPSKEEVGEHLLTIQRLRADHLEAAQVRDQRRTEEVKELKGKLILAEKEKVGLEGDLMSMREKCKREINGREVARWRFLGRVVVRARSEALSEYKEGGFEIDEELARLRDKEIEFDIDYGAATVYDPSLDRIDLPQSSEDSINRTVE
ncbi:hypothetical protein F2Q70_00017668 [Brassica cretica]|uniref:Uncharacterized protein n=1 Tax=Brassica cretica TaxID=69181 RepID=A0A8S9I3I6_BRACR|nr:hypothetical protein F2Q70_00017668 [Brassica cretica]